MAGRDRPSPDALDFSDAPPILLQAGAAELPLTDSIDVARMARAAGAPVELEVYGSMPHNFIKFPRAVGDLAILRMVDWERGLRDRAAGRAIRSPGSRSSP